MPNEFIPVLYIFLGNGVGETLKFLSRWQDHGLSSEKVNPAAV